jgi:ElaB/YqjD/DUF883 family membrane-anchored ribosome-binding protein
MPRPKTLTRARNLARDAKEALVETKDRVIEAKEKTEDVIKKNPLTSVAVAAAVGALVALGVNALISHHRRPPSWRDRLREYF